MTVCVKKDNNEKDSEITRSYFWEKNMIAIKYYLMKIVKTLRSKFEMIHVLYYL